MLVSDTTTTRVFVSYAREQSLAFVDYLEQMLKAHHIESWIDRTSLRGGEKWLAEIRRGIDKCDIFLLVLTPGAVESPWVSLEIKHALRRHKSIIPLMFYPCVLPRQLSGHHFIDFTPGTDFQEKFAASFPRLLDSIADIIHKQRATLAQPHKRFRSRIALISVSILLAVVSLAVVVTVLVSNAYWIGQIQAQQASIQGTVNADVWATNTAVIATNTSGQGTRTPLRTLSTSPVEMRLQVDSTGLVAGSPTAITALTEEVRNAIASDNLSDRQAGLVLVYGGAATVSDEPLAGNISRAVIDNVLSPLGTEGMVFGDTVYRNYFYLGNAASTVIIQIYLYV